MKNIFLILALCLCVAIGCARTQPLIQCSYSDIYSLNFRPVSPLSRNWQMCNPDFIFSGQPRLDQDSVYTVNFKPNQNSPFKTDALHSVIRQRILLPRTTADSMTICLSNRGQNIAAAWIELQILDQTENVVDQKRIEFRPQATKSDVLVTLPMGKWDGHRMLNIVIGAKGEPNHEASIALHRLDMSFDGTPIDSFELSEPDPISAEAKVQPLASAVDFASVAELTGTKIVALGEATHKNGAVRRLILDIIFDQIENHSCRLVLLEHYAEGVVAYNRFVSDETFVLPPEAFYNDQIKEFLDKLRARNLSLPASERTMVMGLDFFGVSTIPLRNPPQGALATQTTATIVFDYVSRLAPSTHRDAFALLLSREKYSESLDYLAANSAVLGLGSTDEKIIAHALRTALDSPTDYAERIVSRDSIMWDNVRFAIDNFAPALTDRVLIYAHTGHVNPISTYPAIACTPLGHYIKKAYGAQYRNYMVAVGRSTISVPRSIENFIGATAGELLYMPLDTQADQLVYGQFANSASASVSYLMNPYRRFAGVILLRSPTDEPLVAHMEARAARERKSNETLRERLAAIEQRSLVAR